MLFLHHTGFLRYQHLLHNLDIGHDQGLLDTCCTFMECKYQLEKEV